MRCFYALTKEIFGPIKSMVAGLRGPDSATILTEPWATKTTDIQPWDLRNTFDKIQRPEMWINLTRSDCLDRFVL